MDSDNPLAAGIPVETIFAHPTPSESPEDSWWSRYVGTLGDFTETAHTVLEMDCRYIVDRGIFGAGEAGSPAWPETRVRRGLVMGSVQSGKTASMLGTIAMSLDRGIDIVVVLAGTRLSLWQQTLERLEDQLDAGSDTSAKQRRRLLIPRTPPRISMPLDDRYRLTPVRVERALDRNQPIIIVALKHSGHLQALGQSLARALLPEVAKIDRPVQMLVVDDEADDGSVLDANVEASMDPIYGNLKQIPRAIVDLWAPPGRPAPENLFATYLAYTATPQANFLQEEQNPLAPRDFLATLRTPFDRGDTAFRSSTFSDPKGVSRYYTGGETYYRRGRTAGLTVPVTGVLQDDLGEAMRAFFVAGAIRLHRDQNRLGPASARSQEFASRAEAAAQLPRPHSMLIHPSSLVADQFTVAEDALLWCGVSTRAEARSILESGGFLPESLSSRLVAEEPLWKAWLDRYTSSARAIHDEFNTASKPSLPAWDDIFDLLITEVIPGTRLAVVNSDPDAYDRPEYGAKELPDGHWSAPRDTFTIFVSGNVMARGLTLEGLTTALFLRTSDTPRADTQMQMQRWFGYRGAYIELCRVFAPQQQLDFFADYHDVDEALRNVIAEAMNHANEAPKPIVLQGQGFLATGKIANLGTKPLHPGRKPFIPFINPGIEPDPNSALVQKLFTDNESTDVVSGGIVRGRILTAPLSILEAADLLDQLQYRGYLPGLNTQLGELWSQVEARVGAVQPLAKGYRLYRPPFPKHGVPPSQPRNDCPYGIPAYFRLWHAATSRHVRGLFVTGVRGELWSMADLTAKTAQLPRFWIGIRYGSSTAPVPTAPFDSLPFPIRSTAKANDDGLIRGTWGTNDPAAEASGYRGDEYFDYYHRDEPIPRAVAGEDPWRPVGADGQILFYVNQRSNDDNPSVAVGVCIPAGGPDQFAAFVSPVPVAATP